jgi:hypothetical protein
MNKYEIAANIAFFLQDKVGSVCGKWKGKLSAKEQRAMFGAFLGKGTLYIDGAMETVEHVVTVGFGGDYDITFESTFANMVATIERKGLK